MNKAIAPFTSDSNTMPRLDDFLIQDIETLFQRISHLTISQSESNEGLREIIVSFKAFLTKQECYLALENFEELLIEKGKNNAYRNNKRTPNILHEIRNCMQGLSMIVDGAYDMPAYQKAGGLDADMSARLRHDSIEDKAQTKQSLFGQMQRHLTRIFNNGLISQFTYAVKLLEADAAADAIDRMSSKEAKRDPVSGEVIWKNKSKFKPEKEKRFDGDTNRYFYGLRENIFSLLGKYSDRIENISTRLGHSGFSLLKDREYIRQTLETYSLENERERAIEQHPDFEKQIRASDAMLGLQTAILAGINKYRSNPALNPYYGQEFDLDRYLPHALSAYQHLPPSMHPLSIAIDNARIEAEDDPRLHVVINRLIVPAIVHAVQCQNVKPICGIHHALYIKYDAPLPR